MGCTNNRVVEDPSSKKQKDASSNAKSSDSTNSSKASNESTSNSLIKSEVIEDTIMKLAGESSGVSISSCGLAKLFSSIELDCEKDVNSVSKE